VQKLNLVEVLLATMLATAGCLQAQARSESSDPLDHLFLLENTKTARISSYDKSGGNHDWIDVSAGETKTLAEISGAGVIRRFYLASSASDRMRYRKLILRMYWDGQKDPCVEVPLGDFFGAGLGTLRHFHSLVVNINPGHQGLDFDGLVSYFPMPFEKGARITLENDGQVANFRLWYHIEYEQLTGGSLPQDAGRFHTQWRRVPQTPVRAGNLKNSQLGNAHVKNTTGEDNYVILDAEGRGSYVGLFLTVDNVAGGWYGEGDDMVFVDGAKWPPTYPGTGHEEIFDSGCCPDTEFWGPYTGFYLIENRAGNFGGKNQMYKFFINDPVHFQKSIRVTVEHGHANNFENDYSSTAFWYQTDPHKRFPAMPDVPLRLPGWPPDVAAALDLEAKIGEQMVNVAEGKLRISESDQKVFQSLVTDSNRAFRAFRYPDYVREVQELSALLARYRR
jgi:hypothetical protein